MAALFARLEEEGGREILYTALGILLCGLPYKPVKEAHYTREARTTKGRLRMILSQGDPRIPLPFGKDRVLLLWIMTRAIKTGSPRVEWASLGEFFELFQLNKGGTQYREVQGAWNRLTSAMIHLQLEDDEGIAKRHLPIFEDSYLPRQKDLSKIDARRAMLPGMRYFAELGRTVWENLRQHPIPLPLALMREFQNEPKAFDLVGLVCYRSYLCKHTGAAAHIPFRDLILMLGSQDRDRKRLRKTLITVLQRLKLMWPECRARFLPGGVLEIAPPVSGILPVDQQEN